MLLITGDQMVSLHLALIDRSVTDRLFTYLPLFEGLIASVFSCWGVINIH